jgi:hypothetical protein
VTLSTGGVGLFDFAAEPAADGTVRLTVPLRQVDDILKSLTVYDSAGVVQGVTLPGATPEADLFRDAPVAEDDLASMPALLGALRGTEVAVAGPTSLRGRVVNVAREEATDAQGRVTARHRVGLLTSDGLRSFVLEEAQGLELADAGLRPGWSACSTASPPRGASSSASSSSRSATPRQARSASGTSPRRRSGRRPTGS